MTIDAINFGQLYRDHVAATHHAAKPASAWDKRAAELSRKIMQGTPSDYEIQFFARMNFAGAQSLLDVGCGPGTLCLPLAGRFEQIVALDYSQGMLDALNQNMVERQISNIEMMHLAWEDDWSMVPECDIVIASRSSMVQDMEAALAKLNAKAKQRVYLTHHAEGHFITPILLEVLGRQQRLLFPDYIYIINILHSWGIHPRLDYIEQKSRLAGVANFEDFISRASWSLGTLSEQEQTILLDWYEHAPKSERPFDVPTRWAFISWEKSESR